MTTAREMQERCANLGITLDPRIKTEEAMFGWHAMGRAFRTAIRALPCPAVAPAPEPPADLGLETTGAIARLRKICDFVPDNIYVGDGKYEDWKTEAFALINHLSAEVARLTELQSATEKLLTSRSNDLWATAKERDELKAHAATLEKVTDDMAETNAKLGFAIGARETAVAPVPEPPADRGLETTALCESLRTAKRWADECCLNSDAMRKAADHIELLSAEVARLTKEAEGWRASANQQAEEANRAEARLRKAEQGLAKMAAAVAPAPAAVEAEAMARAAARAIAATYYNADNLTWAMTGRLTEIAEIEIAALLRRLLPSPTGEGWRPIADAPKTTHAILVWCPDRQNIYAVSWDDLQGNWAFFGGSHHELHEVPTHWRPLPAPPLPETEG
jgi:hypothetical protein